MRLGQAALLAIVAAVVSAPSRAARDAGRASAGRGHLAQGWMGEIDAGPVRHITGISMTKG